jgi:hypothetical protein
MTVSLRLLVGALLTLGPGIAIGLAAVTGVLP